MKQSRVKQITTVYSEIPIHPKLRDRLLKYLEDCPKGKWLFPSNVSRSGHLERVRAHYILRRAFDSLRLDDASTHSMRRTCLVNMSRARISLRTIQEIFRTL
jgi:integrase/recombinase XerD